MNKKIKVLHVLGGFNYGGAEQFVLNIYEHCPQEKMEFYAMTRSKRTKQTEKFEALGGKVIETAPFPQSWLKNYFQARKYIKNNIAYFDAIHIHANALIYIFPVLLAKKYKCKKIILHSHNTKTRVIPLMHQINRWCLRCVDVQLACGNEAGRWMYGKKNFQIFPNAIDVAQYQYNFDIAKKTRKELGYTEDDFVIGHVGRFTSQKNHKFLINIFERIVKSNSNAKLLLVGDGELKDDILEMICEKNIQQKVQILSQRSDVADLLQAMDVFVFPSLYEGLGIAFLEAQAAGLPCIISCNIPQDAIIIPKNVIQLDVNNNESKWAECVNEKNHQRIYDNMCIKNAFEESGFDIKLAVEKMMGIYSG